jgi:hypothetical protein
LHDRVAHDSLPDISTAGLELRLDEHEGFPARHREREHRRKCLRHADEGDIAHDELRRERELGQRSGIRPLEDGDARVRTQPRMELAVADVDRQNPRRTCLQQTVGEASCRCTDVGTVASGGDHVTLVERVLQLLSATRHEAWRPLHVQLGALVELLTRLVMAGHQAGENERLRLRTRLRKPTLNHEHVDALLHASRLDE